MTDSSRKRDNAEARWNGTDVPLYAPSDVEDRLRTYVDHVYHNCPNLVRMCKKAGPMVLMDTGDPLGPCICSRCANKYRREIGA